MNHHGLHRRNTFALRADLIKRRISLGRRDVWVLKDPVSSRFHFFEEYEFGILDSLGRVASFAELKHHYHGRIDPESLAEFIAAANREGLLTSDGEPSGNSTGPGAFADVRSAWWKQPLAIRLPGICPDHVLPFQIRFALTRGMIAAALALMLIAMTIVLVRSDDFLTDFATACAGLYETIVTPGHHVIGHHPSGTMWLFVAAILVTKVVHELAHAAACTGSGARCREMGVLLLFGIPCLYCDVSDTWLMPRRRDRIFVSAAGMIAECLIASVAVLVWAMSPPGSLHDLAVLIVVVASVGTLWINANPLLRYDGYYILSDWVGIPNLAAEAAAQWRQMVTQIVRPKAGDASTPPPIRFGLAAYHLASSVYRMVVVAAILTILYWALHSRIGIGAALPIVVWLTLVLFYRRLSEPWQTTRKAWHASSERHRGFRSAFGFALIVFGVLLVPLPHSLRVGALIRAADERPRYVTSGGVLIAANTFSDGVSLDDWRLRLQERVDAGRVKELEAELAASRLDRLQRSDASLVQPILHEQLASARRRHQTSLMRLSELILQVDDDEQIFPPPPRRLSSQEKKERRYTWTGFPLSETNVGATLDRGTLIGYTGHATRRVASLYVPQRSIDAVRIGDRVALGYASRPAGSINASVLAISDGPVDTVPEEIVASKWADAAVDSSLVPSEVYYEVFVSLDRLPATAPPLPVRAVLSARITLAWKSLLQRW